MSSQIGVDPELTIIMYIYSIYVFELLTRLKQLQNTPVTLTLLHCMDARWVILQLSQEFHQLSPFNDQKNSIKEKIDNKCTLNLKMFSGGEQSVDKQILKSKNYLISYIFVTLSLIDPNWTQLNLRFIGPLYIRLRWLKLSNWLEGFCDPHDSSQLFIIWSQGKKRIQNEMDELNTKVDNISYGNTESE